MNGGEEMTVVAVSPDQVVYVAPSPQVTDDGIVISILVRDLQGVSGQLRARSGQGIISRHHRETAVETIIAYLPAEFVLPAIRGAQSHLEKIVNLCRIMT